MYGSFRQRRTGHELLRAISHIALAQTGHGRVDGDDERTTPTGCCTLDRIERDITAANEVELVPHRPGCRILDVFHRATREGR